MGAGKGGRTAIARVTNQPRSKRTWTCGVALLVMGSLVACLNSDDATGVTSTSLAGADISITAIDPDTATLDTTITVRIAGSGFAEGSTAAWLIDTTETPDIRTVSTTVKSPVEIEAVIAISPDAELRSYSVRIRGKKGKQGIAVEKFRVVAKPIPLPEPGVRSEALDVNDNGVIVGYADGAGGSAARWTPVDSGWSHASLGIGTAVAINNDGLIVRSMFDGDARAWRTWVHLPSGGIVDMGPVYGTDIGNNGTMIGLIFDAALRSTPAAWKQLSPTSWGPPQPLPLLPGYDDAWPERINGVGDIVGHVSSSTSSLGVVWKYRTGQWQSPELVDQQLPGFAVAINDAGAIAGAVLPCVQGVPGCYRSAAFWPSAGATRRLLPTLYNSQGSAAAINNADHVVGSAAVHYNDGSGPLAAMVRHAVIWFPGGQWPEDLGAIQPERYGEARAVNNHGLVVGSVYSGTWPHATAWRLPGAITTRSTRSR